MTKHYREDVTTLRDGEIVRVSTRAVQSADTQPKPVPSSGPIHRNAQLADAARSDAEVREADAVMKDPPRQYVQIDVRLLSTDATAQTPSRHPRARFLEWKPAAPRSGVMAPHTAVEAAVEVSAATAAEVGSDHGPAVAAALADAKAAARRFLDATASYDATTAKLAHFSRRLLHRSSPQTSPPSHHVGDEEADSDTSGWEVEATTLQQPPLVLWDVSPTSHIQSFSRFDAPPYAANPDHDTPVETISAGEVGGEGEAKGLFHFLECSVPRGSSDGDDSTPNTRAANAARCLLNYVHEVKAHARSREEVLSYISRDALLELRELYQHAPQALLAVVSAVGDSECQAALARLLLQQPEETPELKSYTDSHLFFFTVDAISELDAPREVVVDALHQALLDHAEHQDQFHQVLLALGGVGRKLSQHHQERVLATLHASFDEAREENRVVEERFARHLAAADAAIADMPPQEYDMWMAYTNHEDKRTWSETWDAASPWEREQYEAHMRETIARILAANVGDHDGYGLHADYSVPVRHLQAASGEDEGAQKSARVGRRDPGYHASVAAVFTAQASRLRYSVQALANMGHAQSQDRVIELATHRKLSVRAFAVHALHAFPSDEGRRMLLNVVSNPTEDAVLRASAVDALGHWPKAALYHRNEVLDVALRHLAELEDTDWRQFEIECSKMCHSRGIKQCRRACSMQRKGLEGVEGAVTSLLTARFPHLVGDFEAGDDVEHHARRLADTVAASADMGEDAGDASSSVVDDSHHFVRGGRRLFKLLEELEKIMVNTKFQFREGFEEGWRKPLGKKSLVGGLVGAGLKNTMDINFGLFSGFFEIDIDNWAIARVYLWGFAVDFLDAKLAFTGGVSYVAQAAGQLSGNAQSPLGNVAASLRALPGRAIGYIVMFEAKLQEVVDRINAYVAKGEQFLQIAAQYQSTSDVVRALIDEALARLEAKVMELMAKYDIVDMARELADDAYNKGVALLTGEDSPLTKVLNFLDDVEGYVAILSGLIDQMETAFETITGRILGFPIAIRSAVASLMLPVNQAVDGLEQLEEARVEMGNQVQSVIDYTESTLKFQVHARAFVEMHVPNYTALLPPVREQIREVTTVVDTVRAFVSAAGLGVDTLRTILLSYMRSLVPDAKAKILAEGQKATGSVQETYGKRLESVLARFNISAATQASQQQADAAMSTATALLEQVKTTGSSAAAFIADTGNGSPLDAALKVATAMVDNSAQDALSGLQDAVAQYVDGFGQESAPLGGAQTQFDDAIEQLLSDLSSESLPRAMELLTQRLQAGFAATQASVVQRSSAVFDRTSQAWEDASGSFTRLLVPPVEQGHDTHLAASTLLDTGVPPSPWAQAINEGRDWLDQQLLPFVGTINTEVQRVLGGELDTVPSVAGPFGDVVKAQVRAVVQDAASRASHDAQVAGVEVTESLWRDLQAIGGKLGDANAVLDTVKDINALGHELARAVGRTEIRDVMSELATALEVLHIDKLEAGGTLPPAEALVHERMLMLHDGLAAIQQFVLEAAVLDTWMGVLVATGDEPAPAADLPTALEGIVEVAAVLMDADDPIVDRYLANGMSAVRAMMSSAEVVEMAQRVQVVVVVSRRLATLAQNLQQRNGLFAAAGHSATDSLGTVVDVSMLTDAVSTINSDVVVPLREAHAEATTLVASLLGTLEHTQGRLTAFLTECEDCVAALHDLASEEYAVARDLLVAATDVVRDANVDAVTFTSARRFLAAAVASQRALESSRTFRSRCPNLRDLMDELLWPPLVSAVDVVTTMYAPAARLGFLLQSQQLATAAASGSVPLETIVTDASKLVAEQLELGTGAVAGFAAGWFARQTRAIEASADDLRQRAIATLSHVASMTLDELRLEPVHPNVSQALSCLANTSDALVERLPSLPDGSHVPSFGDLTEEVQQYFLDALRIAYDGAHTCLESAVLAPVRSAVAGAATFESPALCSIFIRNQTFQRTRCVYEPVLDALGNATTRARNCSTRIITLGGDSNANGTLVNGTFINGTLVNGTLVNGTFINGTLVNGTLVNGTFINGTLINGTFANGTVVTNATVHQVVVYYPNATWCAGRDIVTRKVCLDYLSEEEVPVEECYNYLTLPQLLERAQQDSMADLVDRLEAAGRQARALAVAYGRTQLLSQLQPYAAAFHQALAVSSVLADATSDAPSRPAPELLTDEVRRTVEGAVDNVAATFLASLMSHAPDFLAVVRAECDAAAAEATQQALNSTVVAQGTEAVAAAETMSATAQAFADALEPFVNAAGSSGDVTMALRAATAAQVSTVASRAGDVLAAAEQYAQQLGAAVVDEATARVGRLVSMTRRVAARQVAGFDMAGRWKQVLQLVELYGCLQEAWVLAQSVLAGDEGSPLANGATLASQIEWLEDSFLPTAQCVTDAAGVGSFEVRVGGRMLVSALTALQSFQVVAQEAEAQGGAVLDYLGGVQDAVNKVTPSVEQVVRDMFEPLRAPDLDALHTLLQNVSQHLPVLLHDVGRRSAACLCGDQSESSVVMAAAHCMATAQHAAPLVAQLATVLRDDGTVDPALVLNVVLAAIEFEAALDDVVVFARAEGPLAVVSLRDHTRVAGLLAELEALHARFYNLTFTTNEFARRTSSEYFFDAARQLRTAVAVAEVVEKAHTAVGAVTTSLSSADFPSSLVDIFGTVRAFVATMDAHLSSPLDLYRLHSALVRGSLALADAGHTQHAATLDGLARGLATAQRDVPLTTPVSMAMLPPELRDVVADAAVSAASLDVLGWVNDAGATGVAVSLAALAPVVRASAATQTFLGVVRGVETASGLVGVVLDTASDIQAVVTDAVSGAGVLLSTPSPDSALAVVDGLVSAVQGVSTALQDAADKSTALAADAMAAAGYGNVGGAACAADRAAGKCEAGPQLEGISLELPTLPVSLPTCDDFIAAGVPVLPPACCIDAEGNVTALPACADFPACVDYLAGGALEGESFPVEQCCDVLPALGGSHPACTDFTSCLDAFTSGTMPRAECCTTFDSMGLVHPACMLQAAPTPCEALSSMPAGDVPLSCCSELRELGIPVDVCPERPACLVDADDANATLTPTCCAALAAMGRSHGSCPSVPSCRDIITAFEVDMPEACCFDVALRDAAAMHPTCKELFATPLTSAHHCSASCVRTVLSQLTFTDTQEVVDGVMTTVVTPFAQRLASVEDTVSTFTAAARRVLHEGPAAMTDLSHAAVAAVGALERHGDAVIHHACMVESGYGEWAAALAMLTGPQLDAVASMAERQLELGDVFKAVRAVATSDDSALERVASLGVSLAWEAASAIVAGQELPPALQPLLRPLEGNGAAAGECNCSCCSLLPPRQTVSSTDSAGNHTCRARAHYASLKAAVRAATQAATSEIGLMVTAGTQAAADVSSVVSDVISALQTLFTALQSAGAEEPGTTIKSVQASTSQLAAALRRIVGSSTLAQNLTASASASITASVRPDPGFTVSLGAVPDAAFVLAAVDTARVAHEDFARLARMLGGVSDIPARFEELHRLVMPLVAAPMGAFVAQQQQQQQQQVHMVAGVALPDLGVSRLRAIVAAVDGLLDSFKGVIPAVRTHKEVPSIMTKSFDEYEAWLGDLKEMLHLAQVLELVESGSRLVDTLARVLDVVDTVSAQQDASGTPGVDNIEAWFTFVKDTLLPSVAALVEDLSGAALPTPAKLQVHNQEWVVGAAMEASELLQKFEADARRCVGICPTNAQREEVARIAAAAQQVVQALDDVREVTQGFVTSASAASEAFSNDVRARFAVLHAAVATLSQAWNKRTDAASSALQESGLQTQLQLAMTDLTQALEGAMAFHNAFMQATSMVSRAQRPLQFAVLAIDLLGSSFNPVPSACPALARFGAEVPDVVTSTAGRMLADVAGVSSTPAVVAVRAAIATPGLIAPSAPMSELRELLSSVNAALSVAEEEGNTVATVALHELRLLVVQALVAQLCDTAEDVVVMVEATLDVGAAAATVASRAVSGDFSGATTAAQDDLMPSIHALQHTLVGPVLDSWAARGRAALVELTQTAQQLLAEAKASPLSDVVECSVQGMAGGLCPQATAYATSAATLLLRNAMTEVLDTVTPAMYAALPVSGVGAIEANVSAAGAAVLDVSAAGAALLDDAGNLADVASEKLGHIAGMLAVARYALDNLRASANATVLADLDSLAMLQQTLHSSGSSSPAGSIQPVLWALTSIQSFFGHAAALQAALQNLVEVLTTGFADLDADKLLALMGEVTDVVESIKAAAKAGIVPSHVVVSALRLEVALVLDAQRVVEAVGGEDVVAATAVDSLTVLDTVLANVTGVGALEGLAPSDRAKVTNALDTAMDAIPSKPPMLGAAMGALKASFALSRILPPLDEVAAALEVVRDSQAMQVAKLLFDVKDVLANGGTIGDAATLVLERLLEQAKPLVERLVLPASAVVSHIATAAADAVAALDLTPPSVPTLEFGNYTGPLPWVTVRVNRLVAALKEVEARLPKLAAEVVAAAEEAGFAGQDGNIAVLLETQVETIVRRLREPVLEVLLLLKDAVASADLVRESTDNTLPPEVDTFVSLATETFNLRCAISCEFDRTLSMTLRAVDGAGTVFQALQQLERVSSVTDLLSTGREVLMTAVTELKSAAVDVLASEAELEPAPTSMEGSDLFAAAVATFAGAIRDGRVVLANTIEDAQANLTSAVQDAQSNITDAVAQDPDVVEAVDAMQRLHDTAVAASVALSRANLFNTFSGLRTLSQDVDALTQAISAAKEAGLSLDAVRREAEASDDMQLAVAAWIVAEFTPAIEAWLGTRLGDTAINLAGASVAALDVLAQQVGAVDSLADLTLSAFGKRGPELSAQLSESLLVWLADLTVAELNELEVEPVLNAIRSFSLVVEETGGAASSPESVQTAVADAFELAEEVELLLELNLAQLPLAVSDMYSFDSAVQYDTLLFALSDWRSALVRVVKEAEVVSPGNASLPSALRDAALETLGVLGAVSDERFDKGPRLVASTSIELVLLMGYIEEVADLVESGADFVTLRRLASKATEELTKRLQTAILKQASGIIGSFTAFVDDSAAQYGAGNSTGAVDTAGTSKDLQRLGKFLDSTLTYAQVTMERIDGAVQQANRAVDQVKAFRDGITGEVQEKLGVFDDQIRIAENLFDTVMALVDQALAFTESTKPVTDKANEAVLTVMNGLEAHVNVLISSFDVLVAEIDNLEMVVLAVVKEAKDYAMDTAERVKKALLNLGGGILQKAADMLDETDAFLQQQQQRLQAWEDVANLALEITLLLRDMDPQDSLRLGELASALTIAVQGIDFVQEKVAQLQQLRTTLDDFFTRVVDVPGWVKPFVDSVPLEEQTKKLFDAVRTRVLQVKAEALRVKRQLAQALLDLVAEGIEKVVDTIGSVLDPINGALVFVKGVMVEFKQSSDSVLNLIDRRELLFELMEKVLSYLDPPIAAVDSIRGFVNHYLGEANAIGSKVSQAIPARRLLDLPNGCSFDFESAPGFDAVTALSEAMVTLVELAPSLSDMMTVATELTALVDIVGGQRCVEGAMCGLNVLEARLSDVVTMLKTFETGLVALEDLGSALPDMVDAVASVGDCMSPVPDALEQVRSFADDFMSGRLFGVDVEGGMATLIGHAKMIQSRANKLGRAVEQALGIFREKVLMVKNEAERGFGYVRAAEKVLVDGTAWAKETVKSLTDVSATRDRLMEYLDMIDIAGILQQQYDKLMSSARTFLRQIIIRDGGAFAKAKTRAKLLLEQMRDGSELVEDKARKLLAYAEMLNEKASLGRLKADLAPWNTLPYCSNDTSPTGVCVRQIDRSSPLYRNLIFPAVYSRFWYETIPPINDKNRMNRAIIPGLFESYIPHGISVLDGSSYLISMQPVGNNYGKPSILVRMRKEKEGEVMRIFQLYEEDGSPFTGSVRDVTVTGRTTITPPLPFYVWTCDDEQQCVPPALNCVLQVAVCCVLCCPFFPWVLVLCGVVSVCMHACVSISSRVFVCVFASPQ